MREYSAYEMNRKLQYMMEMRPVLKKSGLFSDGTADYRIPAEPQPGDTVIIRCRCCLAVERGQTIYDEKDRDRGRI